MDFADTPEHAAFCRMSWEHDLHLYLKRAKDAVVAFGDGHLSNIS
ncbi:MAG TPA: hypothetical protein VJ770_09030 [Stellaceae bacterium]|nr:hypothetical protein [Stellaceae bacterium]